MWRTYVFFGVILQRIVVLQLVEGCGFAAQFAPGNWIRLAHLWMIYQYKNYCS